MQVKQLTLSEVATIQRGKRAKPVDGGRYPVYGAGSKAIKWTDQVNAVAPCIRVTAKGTVGEVYLHTEDFWAAEDCVIVTPKEGLNLTYLFHWLKKNRPVISGLHGGKIIPALDMEGFGHLPFELPPVAYQKEVCRVLRLMAEEIAELQKQTDLYKQRHAYITEELYDL